MSSVKIGHVVAVSGPVVDVRFDSHDEMPAIYEVMSLKTCEAKDVVLEVAEHRDNDICRCIALAPTYGIQRNSPVMSSGEYLSVPHAENIFGRIINVLGNLLTVCPDLNKVKRIVISPKERLSLQMHHHRSEHWVVIAGTARVNIGDRETFVHVNESIYVPKSTLHRLENPGKVPLEIIEVQNGEYLEEDDIIRFEDSYGRN